MNVDLMRHRIAKGGSEKCHSLGCLLLSKGIGCPSQSHPCRPGEFEEAHKALMNLFGPIPLQSDGDEIPSSQISI